MKTTILIIGLLVLSLTNIYAQEQFVMPESLMKYSKEDLNTVLKRAKQEDKMVFVYFSLARIAACRVNAKKAFSNDTVVGFMDKHFISLNYNLDDTLANKAIMNKYHVDGYEFLFLDAKGDVKYRFGGGWNAYDAKNFLEEAQIAFEHKNTNLKEGVQFMEEPFNNVLKTAAKANKLVFVDCYTKWCGPCAEMANTVFPQKQMGDYFNPEFVSMQLNMESPEGRELNKQYKVTSYPTFLILNTKGEELGRVVGGMSAENFIQKVEVELKKIKK